MRVYKGLGLRVYKGLGFRAIPIRVQCFFSLRMKPVYVGLRCVLFQRLEDFHNLRRWVEFKVLD